MKWLRRVMLTSVLLVMLLLLGVVVVGSREDALLWLLQRSLQGTGVGLTVDGLSGSLWRGVSLRQARIDHADWRVQVKQVELRWFFLPLKHLQLSSMRIQEMRVDTLSVSDHPPSLPHSLKLPFTLGVSRFIVEKMVWHSVDGAVQEAVDLQGKISLGAREHRVTIERVSTAGIKLQAEASVQVDSPFKVQARWEATPATSAFWATFRGQAEGPLASFTVQAQATWADPNLPPLLATTKVTLFEPEVMAPVNLQAEGVPLSSLVKETSLGALFDAKATVRRKEGEWTGSIHVVNRSAGRLDEKKIPIPEAHLNWGWKQGRWTAQDIRLTTANGVLTGGAFFDGRQAGASLQVTALQASALHGAAGNVRINGPVEVQWTPQVTHVRMNLSAPGLIFDSRLESLEGQWRLHGKMTATQLNLADLLSRPPKALQQAQRMGALLNGTVAASVRLDGLQSEVSDLELHLQTAQMQLDGGGSFGTPSSHLSFAFKAPKLDALGAWLGVEAAGSFELNAVVGGTVADPLIGATLKGVNLRWGRATAPVADVARVDGTIQVVAQQVSTAIQAQSLKLEETVFTRATFQGQGALRQHVFTLRAQGKEKRIQAQGEWSGGWFDDVDGGVWRGQWTSFENQGRFRIQLLKPANLEVGPQHVRLNEAGFSVADGKIILEALERRAGQWSSHGHLSGLSGQALGRWFPSLNAPRNTLTLGGRWNFTWGERLHGELQLGREHGDVWMTNVSETLLGVERLNVKLVARDDVISLEADLLAQRAGRLQINAQMGTTRDAPLLARARGELTSLAWLGFFTDVPLSAEGRISLDTTVKGTLAHPKFDGFFNADDLTLRTFEPRATLRRGRVRLVLASDVLQLREFHFEGRTGSLSASGNIDLNRQGEQGVIRFAMNKLNVLTDPLYRLTTSGVVEVALSNLQHGGSAEVRGKVRVDQARLTLRDASAPTLGADVVIVDSADETPPARRPFPLNLDLMMDFGDDFEVTGYGAEVQLGGNVNLQAKSGDALRVHGTVQTRRGKFYAFGQELLIEKGSASFSGPSDNPSLHLFATRGNLPVDVGVEITGTLLNPRAQLVAKPEMSETEKMSWLVLGRGLDGASRNDLQLLSLVASTLFSGREGLPLNQRLARNFGIDDIGFRGGTGLEETVVTVGKRISKNWYLSFERSLSGLSTLAKLRYEVARRWYIEGLTGTENAVDIFFIFRFD